MIPIQSTHLISIIIELQRDEQKTNNIITLYLDALFPKWNN